MRRLLDVLLALTLVALAVHFAAAPSLAQSEGGFSTWNADQEALSTTAELVPATSLGGRARLCVQNRDSSINVFCGDSSSVASSGDEGTRIAPGTAQCFPTTAAVYCVSASGTPTIDWQEYAP